MKKLMLLCSILLAITVHSQQLSITGGYSLPQGDLKDTNFRNINAGYAIKSISLNLQFKVDLTDNMGVIVNYNRGNFNYNEKLVVEQYYKLYSSMGYIQSLYCTANPSYYDFIGAGIVFSEKFSKFQILAHCSSGILSLQSGSVTISGSVNQSGGNKYIINNSQAKGKGSALGFNMGGSFVLNIWSQWGLKGELDYLTSRPNLKYTSYGVESEQVQPFDIICLSMGIVYSFRNKD